MEGIHRPLHRECRESVVVGEGKRKSVTCGISRVKISYHSRHPRDSLRSPTTTPLTLQSAQFVLPSQPYPSACQPASLAISSEEHQKTTILVELRRVCKKCKAFHFRASLSTARYFYYNVPKSSHFHSNALLDSPAALVSPTEVSEVDHVTYSSGFGI